MGYIMTPGHGFGIPSDGYADIIWEGYEQCGLDTKLLEDAINNAYAKVFGQEKGLGEQEQKTPGTGGVEPIGQEMPGTGGVEPMGREMPGMGGMEPMG